MRNEYNLGVQADQMGYPFVSVFEEALPHTFCREMIEKFEANEDQVQVKTDYEDLRHFTEINISHHGRLEDHESMVRAVLGAAKAYKNEQQILDKVQWPLQYGYEEFRMKRYLPNGKDEFRLHTDVGNYGSARRFVAFLWYLNTVEEGGQTCFGHVQDKPDVTIPAVQGRLLVFRPLWTHPHWDCKAVSGPKYTISGYLHYI